MNRSYDSQQYKLLAKRYNIFHTHTLHTQFVVQVTGCVCGRLVIEYLVRCCRLHTSLSLHAGAAAHEIPSVYLFDYQLDLDWV